MTLATTLLRLHVRFEGRSEELEFEALRLRPTASDSELVAALARRYDRKLIDFEHYVIVREPQAVIIRPEAFYG